MDKALVELWNSVVSLNDIVVHLGDFGLAPIDYLSGIFDRLNGKTKMIVYGNHDHSPTALYMIGWDMVFNELSLRIKGKKVRLIHDPPDKLQDYHYVIHGHIHEKDLNRHRFVCVSVEKTGYQPVLLTDVVK